MTKLIPSRERSLPYSLEELDTILLDMDGTLLDRHFDDYFFVEYLPENFARKNGITSEEARTHLIAKYKSVENTLEWTDLDYWSKELDLDVPGLKESIGHMIGILPGVIAFLDYLKAQDKTIYLVTNAHSKTLKIKMARVQIEDYFHRIVCSDELGKAKEQLTFWQKLQDMLKFDLDTTLFADDTARVLDTASQFGFKHLLHMAKPSSRLSPSFSDSYPSVISFEELLPARK